MHVLFCLCRVALRSNLTNHSLRNFAWLKLMMGSKVKDLAQCLCLRSRSLLIISVLLVVFGCIYRLSTGWIEEQRYIQSANNRDEDTDGKVKPSSWERAAVRYKETVHNQATVGSAIVNTTITTLQQATKIEALVLASKELAAVTIPTKESELETVSEGRLSKPTPAPIIRPTSTYFDPHGNDSLVFIHIQKTGGSDFLRHLVTLKKNGVKLCDASNSARRRERKSRRTPCPKDWEFPDKEPWLIAEKTLGWVCGLHASYAEFKACLPTIKYLHHDRKLYFMTLLRHPVLRYVSEYLHFQRGASWGTRHKCGGKVITDAEMPPCYPGYYNNEPWVNVTLPAFIACESNWANNRQTMMLADLVSVGCFERSREERERLMLQSAKRSLKNFAYFGITEYIEESEALFERTFGVEFGEKVTQRSLSDLHSAPMLKTLWSKHDVYQEIADANGLDMELYEYALQLFAVRLKTIGKTIDIGKIDRAVQVLSPDAIAHTANKFKRLRYNMS